MKYLLILIASLLLISCGGSNNTTAFDITKHERRIETNSLGEEFFHHHLEFKVNKEVEGIYFSETKNSTFFVQGNENFVSEFTGNYIPIEIQKNEIYVKIFYIESRSWQAHQWKTTIKLFFLIDGEYVLFYEIIELG